MCIRDSGKTVGAAYVGQEFTEDYYMWSRPSAYHYNVYTEDQDGKQYYLDGTEFPGIGSGSNNYAPSNPKLTERVEKDIQAFLEKNPEVKREDIPTDLLTASGSGLDPHISPESAEIQIPRIAAASGLSEDEIRQIVKNNTDGKLLGIFGEETVNVLTVSYTHLSNAAGCRHAKRYQDVEELLRAGIDVYTTVNVPVSYTHLDVYKRQNEIRKGSL